MKKTEPLATLKVPVGVRLLMGEIATRTGEPESDVLNRLVLEEVVKLLRPTAQNTEAAPCR